MPVKKKICLFCAHGLFECACVATNILVFVVFFFSSYRGF